MNKQTEEALRMAIEAIKTHVPHYVLERGYEPLIACKTALQENELYRMAENARELGLDYCKHGSDSACKECYMENVEQEPIGWWCKGETLDESDYYPVVDFPDLDTTNCMPLYTKPIKPLSDDAIKIMAEQLKQSVFGFPENIIWLARAIEKAHGIGVNNE